MEKIGFVYRKGIKKEYNRWDNSNNHFRSINWEILVGLAYQQTSASVATL
jgi:hypothetical protein